MVLSYLYFDGGNDNDEHYDASLYAVKPSKTKVLKKAYTTHGAHFDKTLEKLEIFLRCFPA